jgi:hypothetical protein
LTTLGGIAVTGVNHNYAMESIPERIPRAALPVLLTLPIMDGQGLRKRSEWEIASPNGAVALAQYWVTHMLLYAQTGQYRTVAGLLPGLVDMEDNYATAIKANATLGGTLYYPISYYALPGEQLWAGVPYIGAKFILRLVVEL